MSASTTLEVIIKETGIQKLTQDFKTVATESTNTGAAITKTKTSVDEMSKGVTTVGGKMKQLGSSFSAVGTATATTALSVVNLQRSYRDLEDSQIAVDKTTRRVSLSQEAYDKATKAVAAAQESAGIGSAKYNQALLDQEQAAAKVSIAQKDLGEAIERQGDINQDFWMSLGTTALATGSTVIGVLTKIGGAEGIGGLATKIKGLAGASGLASAFSGIGSAAGGSVAGINGMTTATTGLGTAMKGLALSMLPVVVAVGGVAIIMKSSTMVIHELTSLMKGDIVSAVDSLIGLLDLFDKISAVIGPAGAGFAALSNLKFSGIGSLREQADKLKLSLKDVPQTIHAIDPAMQKLDDSSQWLGKSIDSVAGNIVNLINTSNDAEAALPPVGTEMEGVGVKATAAEKVIDRLRMQFLGLQNQVSAMGIDPMLGKFFEFLNNPNPTAVTKKTPIPLLNQPNEDFFGGAFAKSGGFSKFNEESAASAKKVMADQKTAAEAVASAWNTAVSGMTGGVSKILDAWHKLHPNKLLPVEKAAGGAAKALDKFYESLAPKLTDPAGFNKIVASVMAGVPKMSGATQKFFQPLLNWYNQHKAEAISNPTKFMNDFWGVVNNYNPGTVTLLPIDKAGAQGAAAGTAFAGGANTAIKDASGKTTMQVKILPPKFDSKGGFGIGTTPKIMIKADNSDAKSKIADTKKWLAGVKGKVEKLDIKTLGITDVKNAKKLIDAIPKHQVKTVEIHGVMTGPFGGLGLADWGIGGHATGFQGTVNRPTLMMVGEKNRKEHIYVGGNANGGKGGGGGSTIVHTHVILNGKEIAEAVSEHMGDGESGYH